MSRSESTHYSASVTLSALDLVRQSTALSFRTASGALLAGTVALVPMSPVAGQAIKRSPSGFNLFTVEQDIEVGRQSATTIERQVRVIASARAERFLGNAVSLLAAQAPATKYRFQAKVIDSGDITVLALPGGPIYLSTGLLGLARTEGELAAVLAHAMSHIVLRHGTARASRAYLDTAGFSALGGPFGTPTRSRILDATGGYGLNASFLGFSLSDEYEADALGTELLAKAGYDPVAMVAVFAAARREARRHATVARLASRHPLSADREDRIRSLVNVLGHGGAHEIVGGYSSVRWMGGSSRRSILPELKTSAGSVALEPPPVMPDLPLPSPQFSRFNNPEALVAIDFPENWKAYSSGVAISFAPVAGIVERNREGPRLLQGVIVNLYAPFENDVDRWNHSLVQHFAPFVDRTRPRGFLEDATDDLVRQILGADPYLTAANGSARPEVVDGARGYSVRLSGRSPVTGEQERVTVYTRALPDDHVIYMACVTPARTASTIERACARMIQSLRVNDATPHRH
jgi:Zn-dependent protease with chaperone function